MKDNRKPLSNIFYYNLIFAALVLVVFFYALFFTDAFGKDFSENLVHFSSNWHDSAGNTYDLDTTKIKSITGNVTLTNTLPDDLKDGDCLCFLSKYTNVKVYMNGEVIYTYEPKENLTGFGEGTVYHSVGLCEHDSGKSVILEMYRVSIKSRIGEVYNIYVGPASSYIHMMLSQNAVSLFLTLLIIFFGFIIILIWLGISDKKGIPLDILDLGVGSGLFGLWVLGGMPVIQTLTGINIMWRIFNRLFVMLLPYPFVRFLNSSTRQKRKIYEYVAFFATMVITVSIMGLRFYADADMMNSFIPFEILAVGVTIVLITALLVDDHMYCKRRSIPTKNKIIAFAFFEMAVCSVIELAVYLFGLWEHHFGFFIRIGMVLFLATVMGQFVNWWMRDQAAVDRDRFINHSLQVAVSTKNPSDSIRMLLEYIAKELGASRAFIYEDKKKGKFKITYEWFKEGLDPMPKESLVLNYENSEEQFVEKISDHKGNNEYKCIKLGDTVLGFLGVKDIEMERVKSVDEVMDIMAYFFGQFIGQRKEQERILYYSYHDPVSGAMNRSAMREFAENQMDYSQPFGYVICEVAGLREINDNIRHENTEAILRNTARCLMDAFGDENVYAVSGEEFVCFGFENDEYYFLNDLERAKKYLGEKECRTFIGACYCANGTTDIMNVIRYTRQLLVKDRESKVGC